MFGACSYMDSCNCNCKIDIIGVDLGIRVTHEEQMPND